MTASLNKYFIALLLILSIYACKSNKAELEKDEYIAALKEEKSNVVRKKIGKITYKLIYKPLDYMILAENKKELTESEYLELKKAYGGMDYFTLEYEIDDFQDELLKYNISTAQEYDAKVKYYGFELQNDIFQITGKDTFKCQSFHFERNYGLSPKIRFNIAFAKQHSEEQTIYINDKYLGTGPVKLTIVNKDLDKLPVLKIR